MKKMRNKNSQRGMTLVETMVALGILLVVASGVLSLACVAVSTTENQGHLAARTAEYAQDKMEQLMALAFCDASTDTAVFPAVVDANGTGLAGCSGTGTIPTASVGGSSDPTKPAKGYVDYLDASGTVVTSTGNWEYIRVWQISIPSGATNTSGLKQIAVTVTVNNVVGGGAVLPQSTVVALKSFPF
jgi:prepilin-type N-terminal cleavage/methylation domain-containing protein